MKCTYPAPTTEDESVELSIAGANSLIKTEMCLSGPFTGEDLRFFQHFLTVSRPHLPFGSEQSWITDVPAYSHEVSCNKTFILDSRQPLSHFSALI